MLVISAASKLSAKGAITSSDSRALSKKLPSNKTTRKNAISKRATQWRIQMVFDASIQV